ncbi:MAG: M24 family metallopeptidase [Paracoccaceae bacterium]
MLHFSDEELAARRAKLEKALEHRQLDALLIFAPESHYWLTGYDTFGYCFFQCLVAGAGDPVLLTRSADLRQAELTSNIADVRIWQDAQDAAPELDLRALLDERGLRGKRLGIEMNTHGLTARNWQRLSGALDGFATLVDASDLISGLRLVMSPSEIAYVRRAAELADAALEEALEVTGPGRGEAEILARLQGSIFEADGDYPGNPFIIGSGRNALLCRYASGRRTLDADDQLTLEWAGVYRHYHAAMMQTVVIGQPRPEHLAMHEAARQALLASEDALRPGRPMADVFDAHAGTLDGLGLSRHRLNACGYALGVRYPPSWMEDQMFYRGASTVMQPGMVFFLHMILMDSDAGAAMCLGRTSLVTETRPEVLSRTPTDLIVKA